MRSIVTVVLLTAILLWPLTPQARRIYHDKPALGIDHAYFTQIDSAPDYFALEARCAMPQNRVSNRSISYWRIIWDYTDSANFRYAQFSIDYRNYIDGIDSPEATITLGDITDGIDNEIKTARMKSGINFDKGYNSMAIEWRNGNTKVSVGTNRLKNVLEIPSPAPLNTTCGIMSPDSILITQFITESEIPLSRPLLTNWTRHSIMEHIAQSTDSIEGIWHHLDRENDPSKARMGGTYTIASIWNPDNNVYDLLYLDGAAVNPQNWKTGMIKGHLRPTIFQNHFDLIWYDALCKPIERDCNASISQQAILELNFPLMETRIRLARVPALSDKK